MKNTLVIDANVILRYLLGDHPDHFAKASKVMEEVRQGRQQAFIGEGVVVECVYVLLKVYSVGRAEVADKLLGVLGYKGAISHDKQVLFDALRLFELHSVDIVDAIVVATAKRNKWAAFSFDADIDKLSSE